MLTCSSERPWGLHAPVRSDQSCPRCGWTAPGPAGDAHAGTLAAAAARRVGWTLHEDASARPLAA